MSTPEQCHQTITTSIHFSGSLTVSDAYAATSLAQPLGNKIAMWVVCVFFGIGFCYMWAAATLLYVMSDYNTARMAFAGGVFFSFFIFGVMGRNTWYRKRENNLCKEGQFLYAQTEGTIDREAIHSKSDDGHGTIKWSAFCGYRNSDSIVILYQQYPASYLILSRCKFNSNQEWKDLLQLTQQKLERI